MPNVIRTATEAYREEMDVVGQFIDERCVVDPTVSIRARTLWEEFRDWAIDNGEQPDRKIFAARLAARGFDKRKMGHDRTWTWRGITLKTMAQGFSELRRAEDAETSRERPN